MANRFNQIFDQQYAPIPFQDLVYVHAQREKQADLNRKAFGDIAGDLDKLQAMPGTRDYEVIKAYQNEANGLINDYATNKAYDPNSLFKFRNDIRQLTNKYGGSVYFNNTQNTYKNMLTELENRKELGRNNQYNAALSNPWDGYDSGSGGVWGDYTPKYEASKTYTDNYFNNIKGTKEYDSGTGTWVERITEQDIAKQADLHAEEYSKSSNFLLQARVLGQKPTKELAKQILLNDGSEYITKKEGGFKPSSRVGRKGTGTEKDTTPSNPFYEKKMAKTASYTMQDLAPIYTMATEEGNLGVNGLQVDFHPETTANALAYNATVDPRKQEKLVRLQQLLAQDKELQQKGLTTPMHLLDVDKKSKELTAYAKAILGDSYIDNTRAGIIEGFKKKFGIDINRLDKMGSDPVIGAAINALNNGPGVFVPNSTGDNKYNYVTEDGTLGHVLTGTRYMSQAEIDQAMEQAGLDAAGGNTTFGDVISLGLADAKDWDKLFMKPGSPGYGVIERTGKVAKDGTPVYAIKTAVKMNLDKSQLDRQTASLMPDAKFAADYNQNVRNEEVDKIDRAAQVQEGLSFLQDLNANVAKAHQAIDDSHYSDDQKAQLKKMVEENVSLGDPYAIGEVSRTVERLSGPSRFMQAIQAPEGTHGNPNAQNPDSTASGLYQIIDSTWKKYNQDYSRAGDAPVAVQNEVMTKLYKDTRQDATGLYKTYPDLNYNIDELTAMVHFLGKAKANVYLKTLKETQSEDAAQQAVNEYIKKYEDSTPPANSTVEDYLNTFNLSFNNIE